MEKHPVKFVGAGPGDPELITVKGQKALKKADLLIYAGSLVPEAVVSWAKTGVRLENSASMHLEQILGLIKEGYHQGKRVVRLHSGDPSLYGAIFEQMSLLRETGIPYEVIPGVTAAFAAAAAMGIEYTLPEICQTLILTRMAGRTPVPDLESLTSLAAHQASLAVYLSSSLAEKVSFVLSKAYGKDAPVVVAYRVSRPDQKIIHTTAEKLAEIMQKEKIDRQALIIAGKVLEYSDKDFAMSKLYDPTFSHGFRKANA
ncbi:MAG: precorrin-4 C(11)-methyltransferase [Desulfobacterales bacterium]